MPRPRSPAEAEEEEATVRSLAAQLDALSVTGERTKLAAESHIATVRKRTPANSISISHGRSTRSDTTSHSTAPPAAGKRIRRTTRHPPRQPSSIPYLPPEIVEQIIASSVPRLPSSAFVDSSFKRRAVRLKVYTLVSWAWRVLARRELFRWPVLRGLKSIRDFLETLRREPALGARVERLRIRGTEKSSDSSPPHYIWSINEEETAGYIVATLEACREIKQLWLRGVQDFELGWLGHLNKLEHLRLFCVRNRSDASHVSSPPVFTALRSLSLNEVRYAAWIPHLLTTTALPLLTSLTLHDTPFEGFDLQHLRTIAFLSRLEIFGLEVEYLPIYPFSRLPHLIVLWSRRFLDGSIGAWPQVDPEHQSAIRQIRFVPPSWDLRAPNSSYHAVLASILNQLPHCLINVPVMQSVEVIYVPAEMKEIVDRMVRRLPLVCARRGIDLVYDDASLDDTETVMSAECWRRARAEKIRVDGEAAEAAAGGRGTS